MAPGGSFVTANLVVIRGGKVHVLAQMGGTTINALTSKAAMALFERSAATPTLVATRVVRHGLQRFAYLMSYKTAKGTFVAGAGQPLPANRKIVVPKNSPDAGLNVAIYFGRKLDAASLIETNAPRLPLTGTVARASVPFGTSVLTLVVSPIGSLVGTWSAALPWVVLAFGILISSLIATAAERQIRRRASAEELASEIRDLYSEERANSLRLQRALLPRTLPTIDGVELASRYIPGELGAEVGGDWYSVVEIDEQRFAFVVGDVSGRGVAAATVMAALRHTIRTLASLGFAPEEILEKASAVVDLVTDGHFATALVGVANNKDHTVTLASAGHAPALLISEGMTQFVGPPPGVPLGIVAGQVYESVTITVPRGSTLVAFTDGLVERRGETIDEGMERLRDIASADAGSADELMTRLVEVLLSGRSEDDTAALAIHWQPLD
jgi:serine phosphatase RsbU (regulator of sigma subunit)